MKRFFTFYILLFLACNGQKPKGEFIKFDPNDTTYDFGIVKESDTLRTTFVFKNQLDSELIIEKTFTSRKNMQIIVKDSILKPNETTEVEITFLTHNLKGKQKVPIRLKTNNKSQEYLNYYITAEIKTPMALVRSNFFDLILEKKHTSDSLSKKKFDFSKRFTKKEIVALDLDSAQIGPNEYYFLTNEKFLKEQIDSISFSIYYRHLYGYQLEKILRVERKDTVVDITLSMIGGDGLDGDETSTEFENDSLLRKTFIKSIALADDQYYMADWIESIVTKYIYDNKLNMKVFKKDTLYSKKEILIDKVTGEKNVQYETIKKLGSINETELFYGFHNSSSSYTDRVSLYKKKGEGLVKLINFDSGGSLLDESKLVWLNQHPFVYFSFSETSGHSYGTLYSIDKTISSANEVTYDYGDSKVADSLEVRNGVGPLLVETNKFSSFSLLISKNSEISYGLTREFKLVKIEDDKFVLQLFKQNIKELE